MAVTINQSFVGTDTIIVTITATADADTTATIVHGLGATPAEVYATQLIGQALTALSAWAVTTIGSVNVVCTKQASTGSGNASPQLLVIIKRPHSIGR